MRCDKPGRRGCQSKPTVVRVPGKPPMIVFQHERSCPWMEMNLAEASEAAGEAVLEDAQISPGAYQQALAEIAAAKGWGITFSEPGEPWYVQIEDNHGAGEWETQRRPCRSCCNVVLRDLTATKSDFTAGAVRKSWYRWARQGSQGSARRGAAGRQLGLARLSTARQPMPGLARLVQQGRQGGRTMDPAPCPFCHHSGGIMVAWQRRP